MSVRRLIIEVDTQGLNVSEFCRLHGISRWFFYDLRRRYAAEGVLEPRSRAPKTVRNRVSAEVEEAIITERKRLEEAGLDAGPATIAFHLPARLGPGVKFPSEATIWRVLTRRGFIVAQPEKAPRHSYRTFQAEWANECWQIDDTDWALADGTPVQIINLLDDRSRVVTRSQAVRACNTETAFQAFCEAAERWGWPAGFLSDNAKEFRHGLAEALAVLGIKASHSRPYHPQTCGKVERFQQTLKKWLAAQPRAGSLPELGAQLERFCEIYNHERPHRSLGRCIPAEVFAATPKAGPADRPLGQPSRIYRARVAGNGFVPVGRRYAISVGSAHIGDTATVIVTGLACHVFIGGRLVRRLTLDPSRHYQPLYNRPGRPSKVESNV